MREEECKGEREGRMENERGRVNGREDESKRGREDE